ncbi:MAG: prolyl oligopeptidase family serine peptidase, partial [Terracidiphilus sp.]
MRKFAFAFLLVVLAATPFCSAQQKRPMTFEDMMKMKRLGETAVSPDGRWLAYSVTTVNLEQNTKTAELWLQAIAPASGASAEPFKIAVTNPNDSGIQFSADGKRILFLSDREGGKQQVWAADFDAATGTTSNAKNLTKISTEADNAQWSPDGHFVVFTSSVYPDCPAITAADFGTGDKCNADRDAALAASKVKAQIFTHLLYRHWNHFTGDKRSHLFLLTVESGAVRDLTPNDAHDVPPFSLGGGGGFSIAPDSKELAFTENPDAEPAISTSAQIYTLDLTDAAAKPVKVSTSAGGNFNPAYSPDGKWLAWKSQARAGYESDKFRLMVYDRAAKTEKNLLPNFENWVDEFAWEFTWTDGTQHILLASGEKGESALYQTDLNGQTVRRFGQVPGEWGDIHYAIWNGPSVPGLTPSGMDRISHGYDVVIGSLMRVDRPSEVVAADLIKMNDDGQKIVFRKEGDTTGKSAKLPQYEPVQLTHLNDALLSQLDQEKMASFWFTAEDKTKLQGFIIQPPGFDASKKYPVKFLIHGGPQGAWGDAWSYRWNAELFAANGYVVIMINPRGSTGYGQA